MSYRSLRRAASPMLVLVVAGMLGGCVAHPDSPYRSGYDDGHGRSYADHGSDHGGWGGDQHQGDQHQVDQHW